MIVTERALAPLTTLGVGGLAQRFFSFQTATEADEALRWANAQQARVFVLAGGSNVLASDEGFSGLVLHVGAKGIARSTYGGRAYFTVSAGESWDALVAAACAEGLQGIECLSGIPGSAGATPIQNVGAYGQEVQHTIVSVDALHLQTLARRTFAPSECGFAYRSSLFKRSGEWLVLGVTLALVESDYSAPVRYAELARALAIKEGDCAPLARVREAVLELRRAKAMVIDEREPDSKSAGSFFLNPLVTEAEALSIEQAAGRAPPRFAALGGKVKIPAAWLVEAAGFTRGETIDGAGISHKHALALVNRGGSARAIYALSARIAQRVTERFGVALEREPVLLGDF